MMVITLFFIFNLFAVCPVFSLRINNPFRSSTILTKRVIGVIIGSYFTFSDVLISPQMHPQSVIADSTGKMSTKLTAKRRYLPRIKEGVIKFNAIIKDNSLVTPFIKDELPSLLRAMNLFGASLRKGEVPDETSRQAEAFCTKFSSSFVALSKSSKTADTKAALEAARAALDEYLSFAKLSTSSSAEYSN